MKNRVYIYLGLLLLCFAIRVSAQTSSDNYVEVKTMVEAYNYEGDLDPNDESALKIRHKFQYYDGLGRPTITADGSVNTKGTYVISGQTYDNLGRVNRNYLPFEQSSSNNMTESSFKTVQAQHLGAYAYSDIAYDEFGHKSEVSIPGSLWVTKNKKNRYTSTFNDKNEVKYYEAPLDQNTLIDNGYYQAGALTKETSWDADSCRVECFYDMRGLKVLEKRYSDISNTSGSCTYYVYNDLSQLRYVLMPEYQLTPDETINGYEYRYDIRGRLHKKILPGCDYIEYWYDKADHLTYMQDALLREQNKFRFMLYDYLGRVAIQGICSQKDISESMDGTVSYSENSGGILHTDYVVGAGCTITNPVLETVNYYDDYRFLNGSRSSEFSNLHLDGASDYEYSSGYLTGTISQANNGELLYSCLGYDIKGNLLESKAKGLKGDLEHITNTYSFSNKILTSNIKVAIPDGKTLDADIENTYYEENDKVKNVKTTINYNGQQESSIINYSYDEFGRLANVKRPLSGSKNTSISYDYDLHGWLSHIGTTTFQEKLYYAENPYGAAAYNGNISSLQWNDNFSDNNRGYTFTYDKMNRMTEAVYGEQNFTNNVSRFNESVHYNSNSSADRIIRNGLKQNGSYGAIDDLALSYTGAQLSSVDENADNVLYEGAFHFNGSKGSSSTFLYNGNGALICDASKGITHIDYDNNNNPIRIQFADGNVTRYVYSPSGVKLRTIHYTAVPNITVPIGTTHTLSNAEIQYVDSTDYLLSGHLIVENGKIDKYMFDGGYCQFNNTELCKPNFFNRNIIPSYITFYYFTSDHLGNIREVIDNKGQVLESTNYYPFGTPFAHEDTGIQPFKYNGKELDKVHGLNTYAYGARQYNSVLCQWTSIDPMHYKYYPFSPYVYCVNNPINFLDPDGRKPNFKEAVIMAKHVYGFSDRQDSQYNLQRTGWSLTHDFDDLGVSYESTYGFKCGVYQRMNSKTNKMEYCLAFAGTDVSQLDVKDAVDDVNQFFGGTPDQYKMAIACAETLSLLVGDSELTFVGHSLGGGEAAAASMATGREAITFNPASVNAKSIKGGNSKNIQNYISSGDQLNSFQDFIHNYASGISTYVNTGKHKGHSINNFYYQFYGK